jgi:hypothetical protein
MYSNINACHTLLREMGVSNQVWWDWNGLRRNASISLLALLFISCSNLVKFLNLQELQFPHLKNESPSIILNIGMRNKENNGVFLKIQKGDITADLWTVWALCITFFPHLVHSFGAHFLFLVEWVKGRRTISTLSGIVNPVMFLMKEKV